MSIIHISENAYDELQQMLAKEGYRIALQRQNRAVSAPVSTHPDIYVCKLGTSPKSPIFHGDINKLGPKYPEDVLYNAVVTEKFMICNKDTVSPELIQAAQSMYPELRLIKVKQGYTKCNVIPVDDIHFITEDRGIAKALDNVEGTECLLIDSGHVLLPGFDRGFIGGCCGRLGNDIWFNGDITKHPDFKNIYEMINKCGLGIKYISEKPLLDIGSIIEEPKQ